MQTLWQYFPLTLCFIQMLPQEEAYTHMQDSKVVYYDMRWSLNATMFLTYLALLLIRWLLIVVSCLC